MAAHTLTLTRTRVRAASLTPFVLLLLIGRGTIGTEYRISSASDIIEFSRNVSSGTRFEGTTVFLDADIDFSGGGLSEQFEPIGKSTTNYFQGTFDGQGYTISNLAVNSTSAYAGLFGYSNGATIRNVVLDSSCSVVSSYSGSYYAFVGGVIGRHLSGSSENIINMASVTLSGNTSKYNVYLGGITGYIVPSSNSYSTSIKNCVNYGTITHSGATQNWGVVGGLVGMCEGKLTAECVIKNSLNYGNIVHSGVSKSLALGGIVGTNYYGVYDNCVNFGEITSNKASNYIGSVVGYINSGSTAILHCYWSSDVGYTRHAEVEVQQLQKAQASIAPHLS